MSFTPFHGLPATLLGLGADLAVGIALGVLYFRALWWNTRRFVQGDRAIINVALMIGRIMVLGCVLVLASLEGALPLLVMSLGILIGRSAVMRQVRGPAL
ncbi:MAG: ATP synthase subunit I [Xanthobacteraceae bacterium]